MKYLLALLIFVSSVIHAQPVTVLMYHHVTDAHAPGETVVGVNRFDQHMKMLKDEGYITITADLLSQHVAGRLPLPPKVVAITFDDGWKNNVVAAEILNKYQHTATFYVLSGMWEHPDYLSKEELIKLSSNPRFEIGAHSHTHFMEWHNDMSKATDVVMTGEIAMSKIMIERVIGKPVTAFAWPFGYSRPNLIDFAKDLGFKTTAHVNSTSGNQPGTSPMFVQRINIDGNCTADDVLAMVQSGALKRCVP